MMAFFKLSFKVVVCICALITDINADVSLEPSGNVYVCANGSEVILTCVTEGSLIWRTPTGTQLFTGQQAPTTEGRFNLVVNSANSIDGVLRLNSTASLPNFQPELDNGTLITCREFGTGKEKDAVLMFAGAPYVALSKLNSTAVYISWNPIGCMQHIITIINSSDGSVYLNITTSDTNTTVTLPTGVEYCVTVLGVDHSNRTGPPSEPQCYTPVITTIQSGSLTIQSGSITATSPSPSVDPSGVSGGVIAGIVFAVIVIILTVIAAVAVLVIIIYWKKCRKREVEGYQCVCHTLYQKAAGLNSWEVLFAFLPSRINQEAPKKFYQEHQVYGLPFDCHLISPGPIKVKVPNQPDGWTVKTSDSQIDEAAIERYAGWKEPPHLAMMITAASDKTTPPDLIVEAMLHGVLEPNIIKFEKEAQNVVECVCQVFYRKKALNQWIAIFAFFRKKYLERVNQLYQDANVCSSFVVKFGGGEIEVSTGDGRIPAGWKLTINEQYQKVTTVAVEQYTGEGDHDPPYCEMTLRATDIAKSDDFLQLPVTLIGVRQPNNTFNIKRALEDPDGTRYTPEPSVVSKKYVCQVFYHKLEGSNHWMVTLAFFPEERTKRVRHLYQDANFGKTIQDPSSSALFVPSIEKAPDGWNIKRNDLNEISKSDVEDYNGVGKPPHCEMVFKAFSDVITPCDLKVKIIIPSRYLDTKVDIFRAAVKGHDETTL